jgi:hypothetical protein
VIAFEEGRRAVSFAGEPLGAQDVVRIVNSDAPARRYRALWLRGSYRFRFDEVGRIGGQWTYQLDNDGYLDEGAGDRAGSFTPFGDYPEILALDRAFVRGRLAGFQRHQVRLWGIFDVARDLTAGLVARYDSPRTGSLVDQVPLSPAQLARDPGYAGPPISQAVFFGSRGAVEFEDSLACDLSLRYTRDVGEAALWGQVQVANALGQSALRSFDTTVFADPAGPLDEDGLPLSFEPSPNFGRARGREDFTPPRTVRVSLGLRF